jgi:hypothetical protein
MASADIRIRAPANGDRMAADRLARSSGRLNPLGARFRLCAPRQRQQTKDQRKSHRILHLSFAALRHEGHPTEGLSTIVTLLGLRFPPGKDERMFLYPGVGIEALTSRERGAPLRLGLKRNTFLVLFLRNKGPGKGERTKRGRERQSLRKARLAFCSRGCAYRRRIHCLDSDSNRRCHGFAHGRQVGADRPLGRDAVLDQGCCRRAHGQAGL